MRRKRKKKRIGGNRLALLLFCLLTLAAVLPAADKARAVVAGTVFRDPGFAFPRVQVTLTPVTLPPGVKKLKPMHVLTDARGEFAFYPPAGEARYQVRAEAPGFTPEQKEATVSASERVDVYLTLKPNAP
ncbi:MAG TPA: carboxypeptidase-like regulatory domain-containing protein [Bryobacteraceae bacterium]|nr:carboxypeptidase-like regulatory domain-containing protein [Bryobacteraceae bacterium]